MPGTPSKPNKPSNTGYQNLSFTFGPELAIYGMDNPIAHMGISTKEYETYSADIARTHSTEPSATQSSLNYYYPAKYTATLAGAATGILSVYQDPTFSALRVGVSGLYGVGCGTITATPFICCGKTHTAWPKTKIFIIGITTALATDFLATLTQNYLPTWTPPLLITTAVVLTDALPKTWKKFTLWKNKTIESADIELQNRTTSSQTNLGNDSDSDDIFESFNPRGNEHSIHGGL